MTAVLQSATPLHPLQASILPPVQFPVLQYLLAVLQAGDGWVGDALLDPLPPRLAGAAAEAVPGRARQRVGLHSGYRVQSGRQRGIGIFCFNESAVRLPGIVAAAISGHSSLEKYTENNKTKH